MSSEENPNHIHFQAKVFDFAVMELVRHNRASFQPLWTIESWVKFLIWLSLNCELSGEKESLQLFVDALGPRWTTRMRRIFFERTVHSLSLKLMADPADEKILVMPVEPLAALTFNKTEQALNQVGLLERIESDKSCWQELDAVIAIPWQ